MSGDAGDDSPLTLLRQALNLVITAYRRAHTDPARTKAGDLWGRIERCLARTSPAAEQMRLIQAELVELRSAYDNGAANRDMIDSLLELSGVNVAERFPVMSRSPAPVAPRHI